MGHAGYVYARMYHFIKIFFRHKHYSLQYTLLFRKSQANLPTLQDKCIHEIRGDNRRQTPRRPALRCVQS